MAHAVRADLSAAYMWFERSRFHPRRFSTVTRWVQRGDAQAREEQVDTESVSAMAQWWNHPMSHQLQPEEVVLRAREELPDDLQVFMGQRWIWGQNFRAARYVRTVEIVAKPLPDDVAIISHMGTTAVNYGLSTEDIMQQVREYKQQWGVKVIGARRDAIDLFFPTPIDQPGMALAELYRFCPDLDENEIYRSDVEMTQMLERGGPLLQIWWD